MALKNGNYDDRADYLADVTGEYYEAPAARGDCERCAHSCRGKCYCAGECDFEDCEVEENED